MEKSIISIIILTELSNKVDVENHSDVIRLDCCHQGIWIKKRRIRRRKWKKKLSSLFSIFFKNNYNDYRNQYDSIFEIKKRGTFFKEKNLGAYQGDDVTFFWFVCVYVILIVIYDRNVKIAKTHQYPLVMVFKYKEMNVCVCVCGVGTTRSYKRLYVVCRLFSFRSRFGDIFFWMIYFSELSNRFFSLLVW